MRTVKMHPDRLFNRRLDVPLGVAAILVVPIALLLTGGSSSAVAMSVTGVLVGATIALAVRSAPSQFVSEGATTFVGSTQFLHAFEELAEGMDALLASHGIARSYLLPISIRADELINFGQLLESDRSIILEATSIRNAIIHLDLSTREELRARMSRTYADLLQVNSRLEDPLDSITDFVTARRLIGKEDLASRMSGLQGLEDFGQSLPEYRQVVINEICDFLRRTPIAPSSQQGPISADLPLGNHEIRIVAQRVILRHVMPAETSGYWPNLELDLAASILFAFDLRDCDVKVLDVSGGTFVGNTRFDRARISRAYFEGSEFGLDVTFDGAHFSTEALFRDAIFHGIASFDGARFDCPVNFSGSRFNDTAYFRNVRFEAIGIFDETAFNDHVTFIGSQISAGMRFGGIDGWFRVQPAGVDDAVIQDRPRTPAALQSGGSVGLNRSAVLEQLVAAEYTKLGHDHPQRLAAFTQLASLQEAAGDLSGAEEAYRELLGDQVRILGPDHSEVLATRIASARLQERRGDVSGAEEAYRELLGDQVRILGPDHPSMMVLQTNLLAPR